MRLNNFSDTGDHCQAIAARCDLESGGGSFGTFPFGAVDCKATDNFMVGKHFAYIIDGPTTELNPPFTWANWPQYAAERVGMPSLWNFTWLLYQPVQDENAIGAKLTSLEEKTVLISE